MSQNIYQIYQANPALSMQSADLLYLGRSPYGASSDYAITFANFTSSLGTTTPTATAFAGWDANKNLFANCHVPSLTTTAQSASVLTLTAASAQIQYITVGASGTETIKLPVTSTLSLGYTFEFYYSGNGNGLSIQSSGANLICTLNESGYAKLICILTSGTTAASWMFVQGQQNIGSQDNVLVGNLFATYAAYASNFYTSVASTATAAGTTTLAASSQGVQIFTGTTTQTVVLPSLVNSGYMSFTIINTSTGAVTVQSYGTNTINVLAAGKTATYQGITTATDTAASWVYYTKTNNA
jgi:hypothetical protein